MTPLAEQHDIGDPLSMDRTTGKWTRGVKAKALILRIRTIQVLAEVAAGTVSGRVRRDIPSAAAVAKRAMAKTGIRRSCRPYLT